MTDSEPTTLLLTARTGAEAQIVLSLLRAEGIAAYVGGQALTDEFAASQRLMGLQGTRIDVDDVDLERARDVLAEARRNGTMLSAEVDGDEPGAPVERTDRGRVRAIVVAVVATVLAGLFLFLWLGTQRQLGWYRAIYATRFTRTEVRDGVATVVWKGSGKIHAVIADSDHDGIPDQTTHYTLAGVKYMVTLDANEDGWAERTEQFDADGTLVAETTDSDENGVYEARTTHSRDGTTCRWLDADQDGAWDRREILDASGAVVLVQEDRGQSGFVDVR